MKIGLSEEDKQVHYVYINTEGDVPPVFSCFYTGYPFTNVSWTVASGDALPEGINQNFSKPGVLHLHFTIPLAYDDMTSFVCTANPFSLVTYATLDLIIRGDCGLSLKFVCIIITTSIHNECCDSND